MAGNPVSAFLQGFAAVDQLETNRANRSFQKEQRSRIKTLWAREDEEYERVKLNFYRKEKAAEFDAITTEIMQEVTAQIDAAEFEVTNPERSKAQQNQALKNMNALRHKWFGSDQLHNLINEGWKRQIARDPEFGEHLSFVFGKDASAGSLVNSREPVAGVGIMPPGRFPGAFQGGAFFELNLLDGTTAPMTEQRTSAATDRLFLGQPGMAELLKAYGADAVSDKYSIMGVLREQIGGNTATGNPLQTQDTQQSNAQQQDQQSKRLRVGATDPNQQTPGNEEAFQANRDAFEAQKQELLEGSSDEFSAVPPTNDSTAFGRGQAIRGAVADETQNLTDPQLTQGGKRAVEITKRIVDDVTRPVRNFFGGLTTDPNGDTTAEEAPSNAGEINQAAAEGKGPTVRESTAASPTTQEVVDKTPAPATPEAATSIATSLAGSQRSGPPPPEEVYKAYMMARVGLMTLPEVMQFKRTGQIGTAAKVNFKELKSGMILATTDGGSMRFITPPGGVGGGEPASVQDQQALQNLLEDTFKDTDDPGRQQQLINAFQGAATLFGIPSASEGGVNLRANPDVIADLREGVRLVNKFDPDKVQGIIDGFLAGSGGKLLDLKPGDFNLPINATSVAIGTVLAQHGVTGQRESTIAFLDYFQEFAGDPTIKRFGEGWLKNKVDAIEAEVTAARSEARRSSTGTFELKDDDGSVITTVKKGDDRHEVREDIIEYIIESATRL